jgi:hypothetical protein
LERKPFLGGGPKTENCILFLVARQRDSLNRKPHFTSSCFENQNRISSHVALLKGFINKDLHVNANLHHQLHHAVIVYSRKYKMTTKLKRATDEKFHKRTNSIFKKGDELRSLCEVDVYILLHRKGRYYAYKSTDQPSWPPSLEKIVRTLEICFHAMH